MKLENGRAVVNMQIRDEYRPIYKDATILLRPKTGLKDMILALDPGTEAAGEVDEGGRVAVGNTLPDVNPDEVLASLDGDTRAYLRILLNAGGTAFRDDDLSAGPANRVGGPARDLQALRAHGPGRREVHEGLIERRKNIRRVDPQLPGARPRRSGAKDKQLAAFVDSANENFEAFAQEEGASVRRASSSPARCPDRHHAPATQTRSPRSSARRSRGCGHSRASWLRRCAASSPSCATPRPSSATRSGRSPATCSPRCATCARPPTTSHRSLRASRAASRCSTSSSTRWRTTRPATPSPSCSGAAGPRTPGTTLTSLRDAHGPMLRGIVLASCTQFRRARPRSWGGRTRSWACSPSWRTSPMTGCAARTT